ncbi:hypothetical protein H109_03343 [Trichophyton interdigitale MR816]|uniref:Uncharacterized protein n=1 Tax=Trichophyton interdigitale (strain MR816) TaxID=1215338 RepID=A0A059JAJ7_TRIIM|nr:hypothetical protein H109_03343 [Trichophyton interdigitale MR816]
MVSGLADGPYYLQSTLQTSNQLDDLRRIRMSPNRQQRMTARIPRSWQLGIVVVLDKSPIRHMDWWTIPAEALARSSTGRLLFSDLCMRSTLVEGRNRRLRSDPGQKFHIRHGILQRVPIQCFTHVGWQDLRLRWTEKWLIRGSEASLTTAKPTGTATPTKATDNRPLDPCLPLDGSVEGSQASDVAFI